MARSVKRRKASSRPRRRQFIGGGGDPLLSYLDRRTSQDIRDTINWDAAPLWAIYEVRRRLGRSTIAQAVLKQYQLNAVGDNGPYPLLKGLSPAVRKRVMKFWEDWSLCPTYDGRTGWVAFLRQMISARLTDGRVFGVIRRHSDYPYGTAVMPVTRDWLSGFGTRVTDRTDGDLVINNGVGRASSGRIKAYYFYEDAYEQTDAAHTTFGLNSYPSVTTGTEIKVDADDVMDFYAPQSPLDHDGTPGAIIPAIRMLSLIDDLDSYMLEAMQSSTLKGGFITIDKDATPVDLSDPDAAEPPERISRNTFEELPPGYGIHEYDPKAPNASMAAWRTELIRNVAAALGLNYANVSGDLTKVSYSSTRQGELQSRDHFQSVHRELEKDICGPLFTAACETAMRLGILNIKEKDLAGIRKSEWRHRTWGFQDPVKDAKAASEYMAMGATSPQAVASGLGRDFETIVQEIKDAKEFMSEQGVTIQDLQEFAGKEKDSGEAENQEEDMLELDAKDAMEQEMTSAGDEVMVGEEEDA